MRRDDFFSALLLVVRCQSVRVSSAELLRTCGYFVVCVCGRVKKCPLHPLVHDKQVVRVPVSLFAVRSDGLHDRDVSFRIRILGKR